MNEIIKSKIKTKNQLFKQYIQNGRLESDFVFLETLTTETNELTSSTKMLYYENLATKLNNPKFYKQKHLGQSLKHFIAKKIPLIPPLLIDNMFVTDI